MDHYNLLDKGWIPVLRHNGRVERVSILEALEDARGIRCVTLAGPLDLFAVHRFILTLLYWKADLAGGVEQVRKSLLEDERIPSKLLDGIRNEARCFDLFDDSAPLLQDTDACKEQATEKKRKSVGSLFAELATGTNIAHFQHGDDENMRLCLPCIALGMLRVIPWTQSGGQGLTPSIHNAPPIMAIATGDSLALTLGLNLVPLGAPAGQAKWSGHFEPTDKTKPIPYLEALTWNPRRIFLPALQEGDCWYCGQTKVPTVGKIVYMKNENTKKRPDERLFEWQDPAAFYAFCDASKKYDKEKNAPYKTIKSTQENLATEDRDLPNQEKNCLPTVLAQNSGHEDWLLVVPCTDPANNKTFDHRQLGLASLSPDTLRALLPPVRPSSREGLDGWEMPKIRRAPHGIEAFVQAAVQLLTCADWAALSNTAYREMHDSPAAFDVFSGLYWGLRDKRISRLPARHVAWLMLKLMAAVPAHVRSLASNASFCPLQPLPKRQITERGRAFGYPVSLPRGPRLEAALRSALDSNMRKRHPDPVDWIGLCCALDQLLD